MLITAMILAAVLVIATCGLLLNVGDGKLLANVGQLVLTRIKSQKQFNPLILIPGLLPLPVLFRRDLRREKPRRLRR